MFTEGDSLVKSVPTMSEILLLNNSSNILPNAGFDSIPFVFMLLFLVRPAKFSVPG